MSTRDQTHQLGEVQGSDHRVWEMCFRRPIRFCSSVLDAGDVHSELEAMRATRIVRALIPLKEHPARILRLITGSNGKGHELQTTIEV